MLHYDRTDLIKGNNITKIDNSKKCMVCHYWFFMCLNFKILSVMDLHDLTKD